MVYLKSYFNRFRLVIFSLGQPPVAPVTVIRYFRRPLSQVIDGLALLARSAAAETGHDLSLRQLVVHHRSQSKSLMIHKLPE